MESLKIKMELRNMAMEIPGRWNTRSSEQNQNMEKNFSIMPIIPVPATVPVVTTI
ncbi:hypothetical protein C0J52_02302 [Blattella germanica]|nr:hypothetical protein C0J52_02302 [Blattella germanica]